MLSDLPLELQQRCVRNLDIESLKSLRLVGRTAHAIATAELFSVINVVALRGFDPPRDEWHEAYEESHQRYKNVLNDAKLRKLVRRAVFKTMIPERPEAAEAEIPVGFSYALENLYQFENLKEVVVNFSSVCVMKQPKFWSIPETVEFRTQVLQALVRGMANSKTAVSNARTLTINNLQDYTEQEVFDSPSFQVMIGRLKDLHVKIATESNDHTPENNIEMKGIHKGFNHCLPNGWLKPTQSQLTRLSIDSASYWGFYPVCDLRGIHFPNLRDLSLGSWSITHDWQIDWILSHGSTLEKLNLDDCPIVTHLVVDERQKPEDWTGRPVLYHNSVPTDFMVEISMRWYHIFPRFQQSLPRLVQFAIGGSGSSKKRLGSFSDLVRDRYVMFHSGMGPSPWMEEEYYEEGYDGFEFYPDGVIDENEELELTRFPDCDDLDTKAFYALLSIVEGRGSAKP
ncbi:unnamed protein product [Periconia digitata]|uniref:F-box domain-containing protein n=1 Tax=Periconia digitata TaxID=1303443 RepID=A0A9W4UMH4_9PLEO|nr:unnamed protein product [Periconia digitata]